MILTADLGQRTGAQPIGEWARPIIAGVRGARRGRKETGLLRGWHLSF
jgi:hypothetical protein